MTWVKLREDWFDDERVEDATHEAIVFWLVSIAWCNKRETDGVISERLIEKIKVGAKVKDATRVLSELTRIGLFVRRDDGTYEVHAYLKYQPSKRQAEHEREQARLRKQRERAGLPPDPSPGHGVTDGVTPGVTPAVTNGVERPPQHGYRSPIALAELRKARGERIG